MVSQYWYYNDVLCVCFFVVSVIMIYVHQLLHFMNEQKTKLHNIINYFNYNFCFVLFNKRVFIICGHTAQ